jgi:hypothetical protein
MLPERGHEANQVVRIDAQELAQQVTLSVEVVNTWRASVRLQLAMKLLSLAVRIGNFGGLDVEEVPDDGE